MGTGVSYLGSPSCKTHVGTQVWPQRSVSFIPLGKFPVGQVLKQSRGLRLRAGVQVERPRCSRKELIPESYLVGQERCLGVSPSLPGLPSTLTSPTKPVLPGRANLLCRVWVWGGVRRGWGRGHGRAEGRTVGLGVVIASSGGALPV